MTRAIALGLLLPVLPLLQSPLAAQKPETPPVETPTETPEEPPVETPEPVVEEPSSERRRIERDVEERRRQIREGKIIQSHVRVTVWLTNGNRLFGVVKNGRFVERHDGLRFVEASPNEPEVGIRLWYYDRTNSYIFLPFESIRQYRIGERLSEEQVRDLGEALQRAAEERAQRSRELAEARRLERDAEKSETEEGEAPARPAPGAEPGAPKLTTEEAALLSEYPPSAGWGPEKIEELQRRQVVLGVFPNAIERKFIDNFEAWSAAARKQEAIDKAKSQKPAEVPGGLPGVTPTSEPEETGRGRGRGPSRGRTRETEQPTPGSGTSGTGSPSGGRRGETPAPTGRRRA